MGTGEGLLPYNYNHHLAGLLYGAFREADLELAHSLHISKGIKLYTFSQLIGGRATREGIRFTRAHFYLPSPRGEVMRAAVEGILETARIGLW